MLRERFRVFSPSHLRSAVLSIVFGSAFSMMFSVGRAHGREMLYTALVGAIIGVAIWISIMFLETVFHPSIGKLPESYRTAGHGALFLMAGLLGWFGGIFIASIIFRGQINLRGLMSRGALPYIFITGGLVLVVGLAFRAVDILRQRLADSMQRLNETEWARKEIELARSIQTRLLPPQTIEGPGFSIAARNLPAHFVAGDFYDVVQFDDGSVAVVVADVAGKGMGASLIMASVKAVLPFVGRNSVEDAMSMLNEKLVQELGAREFVALAYARFFPSDGTLQLANAGFPDPYLLRANTVQPLAVGGIRLPLGIRKGARYQTLTTQLQQKDRLVFVSDGIPEAPVESSDQPLGYDRLADALRVDTHERADDWLEDLLTRIRSTVREPLEDDWTALVLQFTSGARAAA